MKIMIRKTTLLVLLSLLTGSIANAQMTSEEVDGLVKYSMEKFNVAGAAVAIVLNNETCSSLLNIMSS